PVFVTLLIAQETPAGVYTVALEAVSQSNPLVKASAQTTITVEKTAGVIVRAPDPQEVDPGTEIILTFSVTNRGNVIDSFRLDAFTPRGFSTKVEPALVELLPGETRSVLVTVRVPQDVPAGFEPVTLTAVSLRTEGVQASGATTLVILPPEAAKVPTALYLQAPAELGLGVSSTLNNKIFSQLSFRTAAILPEEQRFTLRFKVSEQALTQDSHFFAINPDEFLFTSQWGAFFLYAGDLPRLPLLYNAIPQRGIEFGVSKMFSFLATFAKERQAFVFSFFGP
ncbi:MAG: NEW3 domain-containing protein, partial [Candidatus Bipolaricaulia bacterium]